MAGDIDLNSFRDQMRDIGERQKASQGSTRDSGYSLSSMVMKSIQFIDHLYDEVDRRQNEYSKQLEKNLSTSIERMSDSWLAANDKIIKSVEGLESRYSKMLDSKLTKQVHSFTETNERSFEKMSTTFDKQVNKMDKRYEGLVASMEVGNRKVTKSFSDSFAELSDSLGKYLIFSKMNDLQNSLNSQIDSLREARFEMRRFIDVNSASYKSMIKDFNQYSKQTDYTVDRLSYLNTQIDLFDKGFKANKDTNRLTAILTNAKDIYGLQMGDVDKLIDDAKKNGIQSVERFVNQAIALQRGNFSTNMSDSLRLVGDMSGTIRQIVGGDKDRYEKMTNDFMAIQAAANKDNLGELFTRFQQVVSKPIDELTDGDWMLGAMDIREMVEAGNPAGAFRLFINNVKDQARSASSAGRDAAQLISKEIGLDLSADYMQRLSSQDFNISKSIEDAQSSIAEGKVDILNESNALRGLTDKFKNFAKTLGISDAFNGLLESVNLSMTDVLLATNIASDLYRNNRRNKLGRMFDKVGNAGLDLLGRGTRSISNFASRRANQVANLFGFEQGMSKNAQGGLQFNSAADNMKNAATGRMGSIASGAKGMLSKGAGLAAKGVSKIGGAGGAIGSIVGGFQALSGFSDYKKAQLEGDEEGMEASRKAMGGGVGTAIGAVAGGVLGGPIGAMVGGMIGEGIGSFLASGQVKKTIEGLWDIFDEGIKGMGEFFENDLPELIADGFSWVINKLPTFFLEILPKMLTLVPRLLVSISSGLWKALKRQLARLPGVGRFFKSDDDDEFDSSATGAAIGLKKVPSDNYRALLHKDERVLTAVEAKNLDRFANVIHNGKLADTKSFFRDNSESSAANSNSDAALVASSSEQLRILMQGFEMLSRKLDNLIEATKESGNTEERVPSEMVEDVDGIFKFGSKDFAF